MAKKKIHELPDPIGAVDLGTSYVVVDSYDAINDEYKTVKLPADEVGGGTGNFVEKTGDTMTGDLVVDVTETVDGIIVFDFGAMLTGIEYVSGTIPSDNTYANTGGMGIPMKSTDGVGQDATFLVMVNSGIVMVAAARIIGGLPVQNGGKNYEVGDEVIIGGAYLGGIDGTDDIICTITQVETVTTGVTTTIGETIDTNGDVNIDGNLNVDKIYFNPINSGINMSLGNRFDSTVYEQLVTDDGNHSLEISYKPTYYEITLKDGGNIVNEFRMTPTATNMSNPTDESYFTITDNRIRLQQNQNRIDVNVNNITFDYTLPGTLNLIFNKLPVFADNATAIAGGLATDTVYKTTTGELRIVV